MSNPKKPLIPPHSNAEAHKAFMEKMKSMTHKEIVASIVKVGILTEDGQLTPEFGGENPSPEEAKAPDSEPCGPAEFWMDLRQNCNCGVWDLAFVDQIGDKCDKYDETGDPKDYPQAEVDRCEAFANGANWMARWIDAILGMANAIHNRYKD